ncbi:Protein RAE1 [Vitis vinifera]|uniref:Protein RAE1 n=1 Tax=Vitis vinifera TaxID=29760 RepID=A0A438J0F8_VITVI|nr:Protein RAE1 [Vitis vinifera]
MSNFSSITTASNPNPNKSIEVAQLRVILFQSLSFSPKANILVATSWDNQKAGELKLLFWFPQFCRLLSRAFVEIIGSMLGDNAEWPTVGSVPKASISHDQPVLCSAWKDDGTTVFSGGCDKQVKMWPLLSGGQPMTVAMHDAPIKEVAWIPEMNLLATGSWTRLSMKLFFCQPEHFWWLVKRDASRYWDTRQPNPVHTQQLPDRCYALTVRHPLMVVGTADRNLIVFNLQNPQTEFKRITSPLKYQTRCVAAFPDQQGFLLVLLFSSFSLTLHGWDGNLKYNIENEPVSRVLREGGPYQKSDGEGFSGILYANRGWDGELVAIRAEFLPY